jgi:transposase
MPSALSVDLRERVVSAIQEGASRRQAAKRFGVSPASALRWPESFAQEGRIAPKPQGGDQRSHRIEAHAELIRQTDQAPPQIVLRDRRAALQEQSGKVSPSSLSRFLARHAITRQKGPHTRLSRTGRMGEPRARTGLQATSIGIQTGWWFSPRPARHPAWPVARVGLRAGNAAASRFLTATGQRSPSSPPCARAG